MTELTTAKIRRSLNKQKANYQKAVWSYDYTELLLEKLEEAEVKLENSEQLNRQYKEEYEKSNAKLTAIDEITNLWRKKWEYYKNNIGNVAVVCANDVQSILKDK